MAVQFIIVATLQMVLTSLSKCIMKYHMILYLYGYFSY